MMRERNYNEGKVYSLFIEIGGKKLYFSSWNSYYYGFELCDNPLHAIHWDNPKECDSMIVKVKASMGVEFKRTTIYAGYEDVGDIS